MLAQPPSPSSKQSHGRPGKAEGAHDSCVALARCATSATPSTPRFAYVPSRCSRRPRPAASRSGALGQPTKSRRPCSGLQSRSKLRGRRPASRRRRLHRSLTGWPPGSTFTLSAHAREVVEEVGEGFGARPPAVRFRNMQTGPARTRAEEE
jgi:hypothetical protein